MQSILIVPHPHRTDWEMEAQCGIGAAMYSHLNSLLGSCYPTNVSVSTASSGWLHAHGGSEVVLGFSSLALNFHLYSLPALPPELPSCT